MTRQLGEVPAQLKPKTGRTVPNVHRRVSRSRGQKASQECPPGGWSVPELLLCRSQGALGTLFPFAKPVEIDECEL